MFDERAFIAKVEAAPPEEFAAILANPTVEEEQALRIYFGEERLRQLRGIALQTNARAGVRGPKLGHVVVVHGIMGGELSVDDDHIWARILALLLGRLDRLKLGDDGRREADERRRVRATRLMKRHYGDVLLWLSDQWDARGFAFDWRKDLDAAADQLAAQIDEWFGAGARVHLVAHSMGGLVARTLIMNHPRLWAQMWDAEENGRRGGRLVMLGTPNHGSFAIPQVLAGVDPTVRKLARVDLRHSLERVLEITNTFAGSYQMLPAPGLLSDAAQRLLYSADSYRPVRVSQTHLDAAWRHHEALARHQAGLADDERSRMVYIAGYGRPTLDAIDDGASPSEPRGYRVTLDGDGRVPHSLGLLGGVGAYYVDEEHGALQMNQAVLGAIDQLLEGGDTTLLARQRPVTRDVRSQASLREQLGRQQDEEVREFADRVEAVRARSRSPIATPTQLLEDEGLAEELLTRGVLGRSRGARAAGRRGREAEPTATIQIRLMLGRIERAHRALDGMAGEPAVDAIAVGHYLGVEPQNAELAMDQAISRELARLAGGPDAPPARRDCILRQYTERGILRGELGQPFFLADPRAAGRNGSGGRVIAIAGLGAPGRCGAPELTVLVRELAWALGRMGKKHLATVLIGSGAGNLSASEAVRAWLRGVRYALAGTRQEDPARVEQSVVRRVTFVEFSEDKERKIDAAIREAAGRAMDYGLRVDYERLARPAEADEATAADDSGAAGAPLDDYETATRMTVTVDRGIYRFAAITQTAAIPERAVPVNRQIVERANAELAAAGSVRRQCDGGQLVGGLLIPAEMRPHMASDDPLVMLLDATTARIHWEMVLHQAAPALQLGGAPADEEDADDPRGDEFLGLSRGLTRQLRTTFAPPPEPPPPPRRVLRVLVIADPAEDAPLAGAQDEGLEVAQLFQSVNDVYGADPGPGYAVAVDLLLGPRQATITNVLRMLYNNAYDVLHYAGHCAYDEDDPQRTGWLFSDGLYLTANELRRIDTVPKFVFSNACESGVTPDRSDQASAALAPSFAEAFFERGVANFVCTAWPVNDLAAREFARVLYGHLLGIEPVSDRGRRRGHPHARARPMGTGAKLMHEAMREARRAIAKRPYGARSWGAYQHYGTPFLQLFDRSSGPGTGDWGLAGTRCSDPQRRSEQLAPRP